MRRAGKGADEVPLIKGGGAGGLSRWQAAGPRAPFPHPLHLVAVLADGQVLGKLVGLDGLDDRSLQVAAECGQLGVVVQLGPVERRVWGVEG